MKLSISHFFSLSKHCSISVRDCTIFGNGRSFLTVATTDFYAKRSLNRPNLLPHPVNDPQRQCCSRWGGDGDKAPWIQKWTIDAILEVTKVPFTVSRTGEVRLGTVPSARIRKIKYKKFKTQLLKWTTHCWRWWWAFDPWTQYHNRCMS